MEAMAVSGGKERGCSRWFGAVSLCPCVWGPLWIGSLAEGKGLLLGIVKFVVWTSQEETNEGVLKLYRKFHF